MPLSATNLPNTSGMPTTLKSKVEQAGLPTTPNSSVVQAGLPQAAVKGKEEEQEQGQSGAKPVKAGPSALVDPAPDPMDFSNAAVEFQLWTSRATFAARLARHCAEQCESLLGCTPKPFTTEEVVDDFKNFMDSLCERRRMELNVQSAPDWYGMSHSTQPEGSPLQALQPDLSNALQAASVRRPPMSSSLVSEETVKSVVAVVAAKRAAEAAEAAEHSGSAGSRPKEEAERSVAKVEDPTSGTQR